MTVRYYKYTLCWQTGRIVHCIATNTVDISNYVEQQLSLRYDRAIVTKHEIVGDDTCNPNVIIIHDGYANVIPHTLVEKRLHAIKREYVHI